MRHCCQSTRRAGPQAALAVLLASLAGCGGGRPVQPNAPELAAFLEVSLPARVRILTWTKPVSLRGDGTADAVEVVLAAYDACDDPTKLVGTLALEVLTRRTGQHIATQVAARSVELRTPAAIRAEREQPSGFYRFTVPTRAGKLAPGQYVVTARLQYEGAPARLDEFALSYDGTPVPPARTR